MPPGRSTGYAAVVFELRSEIGKRRTVAICAGLLRRAAPTCRQADLPDTRRFCIARA